MTKFKFNLSDTKLNSIKSKTKNITNPNREINKKIVSIENSLSNLNNLVSDKDRKIFALKRELEEVRKKESKVVNKLFKAIDNLDEIRLGLKRTNQKDMLDSVNRSIKMQRNDLRDMAIEEVPTIGEQFNSNIHECIQTVTIEGTEKGEIIEVVRRGYYFEGKIIRTAMVITAQ